MCSAEAAPATYVELHAHTAYSFLDGACQPDELAAQAANFGYSHMAVTDHDNLAGALEFAHAAKAMGVRPITGAEVTVCDEHQRTAHVTLLARTREGYANLCQLITAAHAPRGLVQVQSVDDVVEAWTMPPGREQRQPPLLLGSPERPRPMATLDQLEQHAAGLTCLTGCGTSGLLLADVAAERPGEAARLVQRLQRAFGREHVYVELQVLQHRGDARRNRALRQVAEAVGAGVVATGNVHAHTVERGRLHEVMVAIGHNVTLEACEAERAGNLALVLRTPARMERRFADLPPEAITNTRRIAESIEFDLTEDLGYTYPTFGDGDGTPDDVLARICNAEYDARYTGRPSAHEARARLDRELAIVRKHGLSGFFLLHRDILELAREVALQVRGPHSARALNPPGRGRGSSVESIICYLTGLSHVDPVETNLRLGRFLNEDLASTPDIDLDFPRDIRHELLRRVVERYGTDRCAMVAAHGTFRAKSAIRDVGKALGLPLAELTRVSRRCEGRSARTVGEAADGTGPRWDAFRMLTAEIADLPRQIGQHSGGVIVSTEPLNHLVPIQPAAMRGRQICQWDKDSRSDAGFLKIDVLGLGMLSAVEECVETIARSTGESIDLSRIDYDDAAVYDEIQDGDTVGTFQIESRAQIQSIKRVKPENLHDLSIQVALIRPGPVIGKSVNPYVATREARRVNPHAPVYYDHPLLEPVLEGTFGAIIFRDQVIEVAMAVAGFSAGEADDLRRAMTRKRSATSIGAYRERFVEGAMGRGVDDETANVIFNKLLGFSHYGFPRAHSLAFALLAYQSAWLRHHYPAHFYTALLNAQPMGFYPADSLLRDASRHGVMARPVDVNRSDALCSVELSSRRRRSDCIRIGLSYVRHISYRDALAVQHERERGGPFRDVADLARRVALREDQLEQLIIAGATEAFDEPRRTQLWQLGTVSRPDAGQAAMEISPAASPEFSQLSLWDAVVSDYTATGLSVRGHPVQFLRPLAGKQVIRTADLEAAGNGAQVELLGIIVARQKPSTAKGVVFLLIEDESGTANVIVPPPAYRQARVVIRGESIVRVRGKVEIHNDVVNVVARDVWRLPRQMRESMPIAATGKHFS